MAELARGSVVDRPWGRTFATLGLRGVTGQLTLVAEGKRFLVAFDQGAVVAAASPLTADAAVRVALTSHLVSSSQVSEIARRLASAPERDEVSVIAEQARLGPDHALRLRRRVIAQRAARTFSIDRGEFAVTDDTELTVLGGCELDVRAVVYLGARANLSEARLSTEVDRLGAWFRLKPGIDDDLPQFGFTDVEQPVVERLRDGGTLAELEDFATSFIDGRTVRAVVYALAACNACDLEPLPGQPRSKAPSVRPPSPRPPTDQTEPMPRTRPQPQPGAEQPSAPLDLSRSQRPTSGTDRSSSPPPIQAAPPASLSPSRVARSSEMPAPVHEEVIPSKTTTRRSTVPPPPQRPSPVTGSPALRSSAGAFDAPTWRDAEGRLRPPEDQARSKAGSAVSTLTSAAAIGRDDAGDRGPWPRDEGSSGPLRAPAAEAPGRDDDRGRIRRPTGEVVPRDGSSGALRLPVREALGLGTTSGSFHLPSDDAVRRDSEASGPDAGGRIRRASEAAAWDSSSGSLRLPGEDAASAEGVRGRARRASEAVVRRDGSSGSLRLPEEGAARPDAVGWMRRPSEAARRDSSSGVIRLPTEDELRRDGSSGAIRLPTEDELRRGGSSGSIQLPSDEAMREGVASPSRPGEHGHRRYGSSAGLRLAQSPEAGPGLVVRRVTAARPAPVRQVARVDTPQSHSVKALIAQRLKLLDAGADHFQLLGVPQDVAPDALRTAYFALARQLHPDRLAALGISDDGKHAQRLFAQINAGFATLSDLGRRAKYLDILRRGGEAAVRAEQARAEEMARRILEAEEAFRRGELALRRDQPSAAVVELERALQLNPDETDYHAALAWSRFCAAPDKQAVAAATRTALAAAIQRAPRSVAARFYLGRVERMLGRDPEALRQFRDVLAAAPGHAEAAAEVRALEARLPGGDKPGAGRPRR